MSDSVDHPQHYNSHPSGVECITIIEHMPFNIGSAMKYLWREGLKANSIEDLRKAMWYIEREIELCRTTEQTLSKLEEQRQRLSELAKGSLSIDNLPPLHLG